jgi:tetratricopeptide (TPR) repeat protein
MKKLAFLFGILFLISCNSAQMLIKEQEYDDAIDRLVKSLTKNPTNSKKAAQLDYALIESKSAEISAIERLKTSGLPEIWDETLERYLRVDERQQKVGSLPDTTLRLMQYESSDLSGYIGQSRKKATGYHYAIALKHLESEHPFEKEKAYPHLVRVNELMPGYRDAATLLENFKTIEPVFIRYRVNYSYPGYLPQELKRELKFLDLSELNTHQFRFHEKAKHVERFDFLISVEITDVKILPENTQDIYYVETAQVQDGIGYRLDEEGSFRYDSLGNKIEYPLLKTIACYVTETNKEMGMKIGGTVEITDLATGIVVAGKYVVGETRFLHRSAKFKGNLNALSPETFQLVGAKDMSYPDDLTMILRAGDRFKLNVVNFITDELKKINRQLSRNE